MRTHVTDYKEKRIITPKCLDYRHDHRDRVIYLKPVLEMIYGICYRGTGEPYKDENEHQQR